jgi:hypothetical protein
VPLSLPLEQPRLSLSVTVHANGGHQSVQLTRVQPQAFRLVAAVAPPLEGPSQAPMTRHQTERTMALHPPVALAVTPGRLCVPPMAACRDDPLWLRLTMPDRPASMAHHLVRTDDVIARRLVEKSAPCILHLFQAESGFFLPALVTDVLRSAVRGPPPHTALSRIVC